MPDAKVVPGKNKSRLAGVSINYALSPRFDFDGSGPKVGDVFALLLVSRNREKAGLINEIAIGVVDSAYASFLFYEPLETFLAGHADKPADPPPEQPAPAKPKSSVKLKTNVKPFVPPEAPPKTAKDKTG